MIYLGRLEVYNKDGEGIQIVPHCQPFLDPRYQDLEGNGETIPDALADFLEQVEALPE